MAAINLFFSARQSKTIGGIQIDAFLRETHSRSAKTTEYPVEGSQEISDNIVVQTDGLTIEGAVGPASIFDTVTSFNPTRVLDCFQSLRDLMDSYKLLTVATGLKVYENMIIKSFDVDRDATTGQALLFSMTLGEIKIVSTLTTSVPASQLGGDVQQAQGEANAGKTSGGGITDIIKPYYDAGYAAAQ